jgi:hypothetical protein
MNPETAAINVNPPAAGFHFCNRRYLCRLHSAFGLTGYRGKQEEIVRYVTDCGNCLLLIANWRQVAVLPAAFAATRGLPHRGSAVIARMDIVATYQ